MSFRFCERGSRPATRPGYRPFQRVRRRGHSLRPPSDYGRLRPPGVGERVAASLRAFLGRAALLRGPRLAACLEQLGGPFRADRLDRIGRFEARVRLAVRDVGPEAALLEDDRLLADGVVAELLQGRRRRPATALARLRELGERLLERDREHLLLAVERARLLALLDIRAVAAVRHDHLLPVLPAERTRQREEAERVLEGHRLRRHGLQERSSARLAVALEHLGDVRAVPARPQRDRVAGLGVDAELVLLISLRENLRRALG